MARINSILFFTYLLILFNTTYALGDDNICLTTDDNKDRFGCDYKSFMVNDCRECQMACLDDPKCVSYSFDKGLKGCYLKDTICANSSHNAFTSGVKLYGERNCSYGWRNPLNCTNINSMTEELNADLYGSDYTHFKTNSSSIDDNKKSCVKACLDDQKCKAYTLYNGYCWLKDSVPKSSYNDKCISGVKVKTEKCEEIHNEKENLSRDNKKIK